MLFRSKRKRLLEHTKENREEVSASKECGCLNCCAVFPPAEITAWVDEDDHGHRKKRVDQTAVCPHCGEAMVLGDRSGHRISPATLDALRAHIR